jgi:hypothetical protein
MFGCSIQKGVEMKKLATFVITVLCIAAAPAFGGDKHMQGNMEMHMKAMDANGDGMISRDEFMRQHEKMWDQMKKNSSGQVDMKDMKGMMGMGPMHDKMMHGDKTDKAEKSKDK